MNSGTGACRWVGGIAAFAILASLGSACLAHEEKAVLTDISYNQRTGHLEIAHRFSIHDAEHALRRTTDSPQDLTTSVETRELFASYVAEHFSLTFPDETPLKLHLVGQELERGYLWVYQEAELKDASEVSFYINNSILHDSPSDHINTVNVRIGSQVSTFIFKADSGRQRYRGP